MYARYLYQINVNILWIAVKVLHSICQQIWKTQQWPQDRKRSVFIPIPKKGNAKECSNYRTTGLIWHASEVMLKILQARLQQYVNCDLPDVQAGFRKGRRTRDQIVNVHWIIKTAREFQKNIYCKTQNSGLSSKEEKPRNPINQSSRWNMKRVYWQLCKPGDSDLLGGRAPRTANWASFL